MNLVDGAASDSVSTAETVAKAYILSSHGELSTKSWVHSKLESIRIRVESAHVLLLGGSAMI